MGSIVGVARRARPTLASLALLKVLWDRRGHADYIACFLPFAVECIRTGHDDVISVAVVQRALRTEFGLRLPQHAVTAVLHRARREGYIRATSGVLVRNAPRLAETRFAIRREEMIRKYDALVAALRDFVRHHYAGEWSIDDADEALRNHIRRERLGFRQAGMTIKTVIPATARRNRLVAYLVAAFITDLQDHNRPHLADLNVIAQGNMLANAMFLPEPGNAHGRFRNTSVFLDTTLVMHSLGFSGEAFQEPATELLDMLTKAGANLCIYQHTHQEIVGALRFCSRELERFPPSPFLYGPGGESIRYFRSAGLHGSDVELLLAQIPRRLEANRIEVVDTAPYGTFADVMDEPGLFAALTQEFKYTRPDTLERDVASVAAVIRARSGGKPRQIERAGALFVTNNHRLARTIDLFIRDDDYGVPVCITDFALANLVWLKAPTQAPDLPLKQLIADAWAAMEPNDELWRALDEEISKLETLGNIKPEDYYDLRVSLSAGSSLMELSQADVRTYQSGTAQEILRRAQDEREARARMAAKSEVDSVKAQVAVMTAQQTEEATRRRLRARGLARGLAWSVGIVGYAGIGSAVAFTLLAGFGLAFRLTLAGVLAVVFYAVMSGLSTIWGFTWNGLVNQLELRFEGWLVRFFAFLGGK